MFQILHSHQGIFFFSSFFFLRCGPFLKSILNLLQYCFCFLCFGFLAERHVGFSLPDEGSTHTPALEGEVFNHWTAREVPVTTPGYFLMRQLAMRHRLFLER